MMLKKFLFSSLIVALVSLNFVVPTLSSEKTHYDEIKYKADVEFIKAQMAGSVHSNSVTYESIMGTASEQIRAAEESCLEESGHDIGVANLPKLTCRTNLLAGAGVAQLLGWKHTGNLLTHSLQDNPPTITAQVGDPLSTDVKNSKEMKDIISDFKTNLTSNRSYYSESGSVALRNDTDLYLALNKVSYLIAAEKVGTRWTIYTWVSDTYNFEFWNFSDAHDDFVTIINNYAAHCQETGAVVPYSINVYFQDTK